MSHSCTYGVTRGPPQVDQSQNACIIPQGNQPIRLDENGQGEDLGDEEGFVGPVAAERVLFHVPLLLDPDRHVACQQNQDEISFAVELGQFDYFPGV